MGDDEVCDERGVLMADGTIRADAGKIASAVSVLGGAGELAAEIEFPHVVAGLETALPGGSAITSALDRACGAAGVYAARCSGRMTGLADFAAEAHRFLEAEDRDFAALIGQLATR